jgi:hypothetical protein
MIPVKPISVENVRKLLSSIPPSTIYIGSDSIRKGNKIIFCTVVVVHIGNSNGAKIFYRCQREKARAKKRSDINEIYYRLTKEVDMTIRVFEELMEVFEEHSEHAIEVHIDVNPSENYKSHMIYNYALGYVKSYLGITPKFKPEAFAASVAADGIIRGKNDR